MAIFFRDDGYAHRAPDRPHGRGCHIRGPDPVTKAVQERDNRIDQAIQRMAGQGNGHLQIGERAAISPKRAEGVRTGLPNTARTGAAGIFAMDGKPPTPPHMRVRVGVTDEELRKIWAEDDRKAQVAQKLAAGPSMVDRMVEYDYPLPHPNHEAKNKKKVTQLPGPPLTDAEPAGFRGMGAHSAAPKSGGIRPLGNDFKPDRFKEKPRGRRHASHGEEEYALGYGRAAEFRQPAEDEGQHRLIS